jgi:hypothetical protein
MSIKPLASVSLDVDDLWTYLRTHGDPDWRERPSYLTTFVPLVLDLLGELDIRSTFFVVGADGERDEGAKALGALSAAGHEIGNHSFDHEPWLHRYSREQLDAELEKAEAAILRATGQHPTGFRGPGYSWSPVLLDLLSRRGYLYDASTLPTFLGPLARAYYFRSARLAKEDLLLRSALFGTLRDGLRPTRAYWWCLPEGRRMLEIPVTTFPGVKIPFHMSYLLYIARYSERLALTYLRAAATACRRLGNPLSFLLHPLDLLDRFHAPQLAFFPGMDLDHRRKRALLVSALGLLREQFTLVPLGVHAKALETQGDIQTRHPLTERRVVGAAPLEWGL